MSTKKRTFFVPNARVELYAPHPFEVEAEDEEDAESMAVERLRETGEVMTLGVSVQAMARLQRKLERDEKRIRITRSQAKG